MSHTATREGGGGSEKERGRGREGEIKLLPPDTLNLTECSTTNMCTLAEPSSTHVTVMIDILR